MSLCLVNNRVSRSIFRHFTWPLSNFLPFFLFLVPIIFFLDRFVSRFSKFGNVETFEIENLLEDFNIDTKCRNANDWFMNVEGKKKRIRQRQRARFPDDASSTVASHSPAPPVPRWPVVPIPFRYFRRYPSEPVTETPNARSGDAPPTSDAIRLSQTACAELCP